MEDDGWCSPTRSCSSTSLESGTSVTPQPKKHCTEEDIDLTWAPRLEGAESALQSPNQDSIGLEVLAATNMLFDIYDKAWGLNNASSSQQ
jgi:hypothetical protein